MRRNPVAAALRDPWTFIGLAGIGFALVFAVVPLLALFAQSLQGISDIPYDASLVHRVGLEIRLRPAGATEFIPANNAVFTWTPATGGAVESGR